MINILVVGDFQKGSGLTNYLLTSYKSFSKDEFDITCLSYSGENSVDGIISENGWKKFSVTPITRSPIKYWSDWKKFLKTNGSKYDIVHFNYSASWNYMAIKWAKKYGIKRIIVHSHNNYYSKIPKNVIMKKFLDILNWRGKQIINKKSDAKFAASIGAANWMFTDSKNVVVQRNGIEISKFIYNEKARLKLRKEINVEQDTKIIGFVGTLEERKNLEFAVTVVSKLLSIEKKIKLVVFGDGPDRMKMENMCSEMGIRDSVIFMGVKRNLNEWYSAMDVFLFPSKTEGFGFVLLEAQVNGLPCICSEGIPKDAILTESVVVTKLSDKNKWIKFLNNDFSEINREKESEENSKNIMNNFSIEETSKKLCNQIKLMTRNL